LGENQVVKGDSTYLIFSNDILAFICIKMQPSQGAYAKKHADNQNINA
jgi:hypothetical protein